MNGGARKDVMDDISIRMKADGYSETKEYRKNQLDLRKKIADFEKKIATGEMKEYMIPRYERAKALIGRFNQPTAVPAGWEPRTSKTTGRTYFKEAATGKVAWDIPETDLTLAMPTAKKPEKPKPVETTTMAITSKKPEKPKPVETTTVAITSKKPEKPKPVETTTVAITSKKPEKPKPVETTTVAITSKKPEKPKPVTNTVVAANTVKPIKTRKSRAKTQVTEPGAPLTTVAANTVKPVKTRKSRAKVQIVEPGAPLTTVAANTVKPVKTRKQREVIVNQYFMNATAKSLPLPELYDPFTGRKFAPEESPIEEIERAYLMLKKIRSKTWRNANTMRKRALKASTRKNNVS